MLHVDIVTVFPEMFRGFLGESMISRAARAGKVFIRTVDLRDFSRDQRRTVDDKPYSGGPGMLMKPDVWFDAVENCLAAYRDAGGTAESHVVMTTPGSRTRSARPRRSPATATSSSSAATTRASTNACAAW